MYSDFKIKRMDQINGLLIIKPDVYSDHRGSLFTTFLKDEFSSLGIISNFIHDKIAFNVSKGVLRGIHGDFKSWKLVTVFSGRVFQVVVDNRKESDTFLNKFEIILDSDSPCLVLIPPGCGNGFQTLEKNSVYNYKLSYNGKYSDANDQFTLKWNDEKYNIDWPIKKPVLSTRDE